MKFAILLILCYNSLAHCQNLVPNPSFEKMKDTVVTRYTQGKLEHVIYNWKMPNTATTDLITPDFKGKYVIMPKPRTGSNVVGIAMSLGLSGIETYGEYVSTDLTEKLSPNKTYYCEFWIRKITYTISPKHVNQKTNPYFGILFSSNTIHTENAELLIGKPQIYSDSSILVSNQKWVKVAKYFTPTAEYNKLYIGQFREEGNEEFVSLKGYYVIDDILVKEVTDFESFLQSNTTELSIGSLIPLKNLNFVSGTTELNNKNSNNSLEKLVTYLKENPSLKIRINGHTDSKGDKQSNLTLSKKRAATIAQLITDYGIDKNRIKSKGFGQSKPIASNGSIAGRQENRRVEFEIIK